jgi:tetratricopeptide (TPR) repeat protein
LQNCQQYLLKALDIDPQHREARGLLAEVYRRCNEPEKAARELEIAQRLPRITPLVDSLYEEVIAEGVSALWYRERGLAYLGKGLTEKAIGEFQVALQLKPDPQGHNYVGELLHQIGKHEEAARHYRAAINLNPTYPEAFINLGTALAEMGQTQQGIVWIERALRLNPAIPEAYLSLGAIYTRSGRPTEAIAALRRGLSFAPNDVQMATQLAWILATCSQAILRNGAEALSLAKNVCEKTSCRDPQILDVLAAAYAETNQFNKAIETAQKAHQLAASADLLDLANQIQSRLKLYAAAKPYRDNKF